MGFQAGQAVGQLLAVLVGGGLATGTTLLIHRLSAAMLRGPNAEPARLPQHLVSPK